MIRDMFKIFAALCSLCLIALIATVGWLFHTVQTPLPFDTERSIIVAAGATGGDIAAQLANDNIITHPKLFYGLLRLHPSLIKTGEYTIPAHSSLRDIATLLHLGKPVQRSLILAEGLTVKQVMILLQQNEFLSGALPKAIPSEGTLWPDTYLFTRGETRVALIDRMVDANKKNSAVLWAERDPDLPLKNLDDAITLASIVEKETGKPDERPTIAGLFYNRLRLGMPLQTDPTVVYAVTDALGHMGGRAITKSDLDNDSPYNTYRHVGLPPSPIANPGRAALLAVLHPQKNDFLYFVADGTGGHVFATDLQTHNKNVAQWRKIKNAR